MNHILLAQKSLIILLLLLLESSRGSESISFQTTATVGLSGNLEVPGYFCDGLPAGGGPHLPFTYNFSFAGGSANSNLNGCCGVVLNNSGPAIVNQLSGEGTYNGLLALTVPGEICGVGFGLSGVPSCFDVIQQYIPADWSSGNRPSQVQWIVDIRRNANSVPVATWQIKNKSGSADQVTSRPGRLQLCADGMSQAIGTILNTTENPTFSFVGNSLGATLSPDGVLTAGTNAGTVQIKIGVTNTDVCLQRDFFVDLVNCDDCGNCKDSCPFGKARPQLGSLDIHIGLGASRKGAGEAFLQIKSVEPTVDLGTPASLHCDFMRPDLEKLTNAVGWLRQVRVMDGYVDINTNSAASYILAFYSVEAYAGKTNGLFTFSTAPFKTITIELVGGDTNHVRMTDSLESNASDYYWETNGWALVTGGGLRRETKLDTVAGGIRTEVRTLKNAAGVNERQTIQKWQTNSFGERLVEEVFGAGLTARTNTYAYATNGLLAQVLRGDGSWNIYQYDELGRQTEHYRPFLNSDPTTNAAFCRRVSSIYTNSVVSGSGDDYKLEPYTPRLVVEYVLGTEVNRRFTVVKSGERREILCPNPGASWNDTGNLVTVSYLRTDSLYFNKPSKILQPDGTVQLFAYNRVALPGTSSPTYDKTTILTGVPNGATNDIVRGTKAEIWVDDAQRPLVRQTTDISSQVMTSREAYTYDAFGHLTYTVFLDGTTEARTYDCCHLMTLVERDGTTNFYTYDALDRMLTRTRDGIITSNYWNAAGDLLAAFRIGTNGNTIRLNASAYDTAGRLLASTNALDQVTLSDEIVDASGQTIRITTNPDTSTQIQITARDGTLLKTDGTAVLPMRFTNGIVSLGGFDRLYSQEIKLLTNGADSGEWTLSVSDGLGRTLETQFSGNTTNRSIYNQIGQLVKQVDPDGVTMLFAYDNLGQLEYQAVDVNTNGVIDLSGVDRVTRSVTEITNDYTLFATIRRTRTYTYAISNSASATLLSEQIASIDGRRSWSIASGLTNYSLLEYLGAGRTRVTQTSPDGTQTVQESQAGRTLFATTSHPQLGQLARVDYGYDAHHRRTTITDARTGTTTYTFDYLDRVLTMTTPAPAAGESAQVTTVVYDSGGQVAYTQAPDGLWTTNEYYLNGQTYKTTGARTYPVEYTYDYAGRVETMKTWQDYAGNAGAAVTTWKYDGQHGWLTNKLDAAGQGPTYTYTKAGRLATRTWARGVSATYDYTAAGDLLGVNYSDSTPDVSYTFDRLGRPAQITGATTNNYIFTTQGLLVAEDVVNKSWNYTSQNRPAYDSLLRRSALTNLSLSLVQSYGYDAASRYQTVSTLDAEASTSVAYGYLSNSPLVSTLAFQRGGVTRLTTTNSYDNLNRLRLKSSFNSQLPAPISFSYAYNAANQRTAVTNADNDRWAFGYDRLGQVTNGWRYWADGSNVLGQTFNYQFDDIGNRKSTAVGGDEFGGTLRSAAYGVNLLNQYTNRTVPGYLEVSGTATNTATVYVNGTLAERQDDYFRREVSINNSGSALAQWLTSVATNAYGTTTVARLTYVPQTPEAYTYDADGNLTQDGLWQYTWDGENRLKRMETRTNAITDSAYWQRIDCDYDCMSRRVRKRTYAWNPSASDYQLTSSVRFFYDGWNLIGQVDEVTGARMSFLWGMDLSGSLQGAGGVGGLVAVTVHNGALAGTYFYAHAGNGNVATLVNAADGTEAARYEYGPFGESLRATGVMALINPFRFSTKYQDNESDLIYYGYRYYSQSTGRWLGKDPLEELGGANLYGFVFNGPTIYFDVNGDYTLGEWAQIGGAYYEGLGIGAANVGKAAWGLIKSPYTITKSLSEAAGHLSTQYGRQRFGEQLYLASQVVERFQQDECFRRRMLALFGDEAKIYFTDPYKLSELFAEIGVAAATAGAGAWAETANGAEKLAKLAQLLEEIKLGRFGRLAAEGEAEGFIGGCFVAGTLVATEDGFEEIQNIQTGDVVWSFDQESGTWGLKQVERTFVHQFSGDIITVGINGAVVETSGNHPFWVVAGAELMSRPQPVDVPVVERASSQKGRWVEARSLRVGDVLLLKGNEQTAVERIERRIDRALVYNIQVADNHTYAVSGQALLVHNKAAQIKPIPVAEETGFVLKQSDPLRKINWRPESALDTAGNWGLREGHIEKHIFGNGPTALKQIDPGGNPEIWLRQLNELASRSVTSTTKNGMLDIVGQFPKAGGGGSYRLGIRLSPNPNGSFDLITILTKQ